MAQESGHSWNLTAAEAIALQHELHQRIRLEPLCRPISTIAGADVSFNRFSDTIYAGVVVLRLDDLSIVETTGLRTTTRFPYIPGLLSFREAPAILEAWAMLKTPADAIMLDGQGIAHPRRFGLACHVGLLLGIPAIGCAKSLLVGTFDEPAPAAGSRSPLFTRNCRHPNTQHLNTPAMYHESGKDCPNGAHSDSDQQEKIGVVLRTKNRVRPLFVSPGHLIDCESAVDLVLKTTAGYRQPEPTRQAHLLVNRLRRADLPES